MKKIEQIELNIYEALGIKSFRKLVFGFRNIICLPSTRKMTKEERNEHLNSIATNYNIGEVFNIDSVKEYKKQIYFNALIHTVPLIVGIPYVIKMVNGTLPLLLNIFVINGILLNGYCVMLQRYNCIRINDLLKRMTPRYERKKEEIKKDIVKEIEIYPEKSYKIVNKKGKEKIINFDEVIKNCSLEELKYIRDYLKYIDLLLSNNKEIEVPLMNQKTLKLDIRK